MITVREPARGTTVVFETTVAFLEWVKEHEPELFEEHLSDLDPSDPDRICYAYNDYSDSGDYAEYHDVTFTFKGEKTND